jgi:hypothetical protein
LLSEDGVQPAYQRVTGLSACTARGSKCKTRGLMPTGGRNKPRMIISKSRLEVFDKRLSR